MEVAGVSQPDPGVVPGFLAQMHQLEGLVISDPPDSDIEIAVLRLPKLVVLHLHGDLEMTPAMLYSSSIMMSRLRELKLEYIEIAADSLRSFVSRLPSLEVFEFILNYPNGHGNLLSRFDVSDDILLPLTNSKRLQKLVLRDRLSGDREHSVSMSTLSRLCEACRQIESLHILFKRYDIPPS